MKVIDIKKIDGCLEGRNVWDVLLDGEISKEFIEYLGNNGKLIYQKQMEKPFFTIILRGKYTIKGSQTNHTFRAILPEKADIEILDEIKDIISKY
jgi:hypothetical protein